MASRTSICSSSPHLISTVVTTHTALSAQDCFIDYDKAASSSTVRVCSRPLVKDCGGGGGGGGEVECSTHQQTECVTREEEHQVQEDRAECRTVTERRCGDTQLAKLGIQFPLDQQQGTVKQLNTDTEDADTEDTAASSGAQETRCTEWPRQECEVRPVNVTRTSPVTECRAVPVELCGPARCPVKVTRAPRAPGGGCANHGVAGGGHGGVRGQGCDGGAGPARGAVQPPAQASVQVRTTSHQSL